MLTDPVVPSFCPGDRVQVVKGSRKGRSAIVQDCTRCYLNVLFEGDGRGIKPTAGRVSKTSVLLPLAVETKLPVSREAGRAAVEQTSVETMEAAVMSKTNQITRLNYEIREMRNQINAEKNACQQYPSKQPQHKDSHIKCEKNACLQYPAKQSQQQDVDFRVEDRVRINWDREWRWGRTTKHMKPTSWEGKEGTLTKVTPCYVWVRMDGEAVTVLKKKKHNVTLLRKSII
jgi:hypothetical protein